MSSCSREQGSLFLSEKTVGEFPTVDFIKEGKCYSRLYLQEGKEKNIPRQPSGLAPAFYCIWPLCHVAGVLHV